VPTLVRLSIFMAGCPFNSKETILLAYEYMTFVLIPQINPLSHGYPTREMVASQIMHRLLNGDSNSHQR